MTEIEKDSCVFDIREGDIVSTEDKRLTLAYEGLTEVPRNLFIDYGPILEILDLSHNLLTHVDFLTECHSLTTIILDHNHITSSVIFPHSPTLTTLWLNHNFIDKLHPFIDELSVSCPNLTCLSLMGNQGAPSYLNGGTFYEYLQYRLFVVSHLEKLEYLDDRHVSQDEREEANRLYGRPFYKSFLSNPQQYFSRFQKRFKEMMESFPSLNLSSSRRATEDEDTFFGFGEAIRVQDMGTIHTDSTSSTSVSIQNTAKKTKARNLVI